MERATSRVDRRTRHAALRAVRAFPSVPWRSVRPVQPVQQQRRDEFLTACVTDADKTKKIPVFSYSWDPCLSDEKLQRVEGLILM